MKTLVVYGSKYGTTQKCAEEIGKKIVGKVDVINLKDKKDIRLAEYDKIVIGSSIYAGMLRKEVKNFYEMNKEVLKKKKVAIFLCCMDVEGLDNYLNTVFEEEFRNQLVAKVCCGGEFNFSKMNFFEKFIIKKITQMKAKEGKGEAVDGKTDVEMILHDHIEAFVKNINNA